MIAKGNLHGDGARLARYLMTGEKGEVAELLETRGLDGFGKDPVAAFAMLQRVAEAQTNCEKPFFHGQMRLAPGERLTDAEWREAVDRMEKRLGFTGQPRIVSFHIDQANGEKHLHVGWCRIDLEQMRAKDPGMFKNHLKQLSRTLEKDFALREVSNYRKPDDRTRAAGRAEFEEARRLKTDLKAIRNTILDCLQQSDSGKALHAALGTRGLMLANGDRRDCFVVIDQAGGQHALNKRLSGLTLAAIRERLADLDRQQLPSVEEAKAQQRVRHPERGAQMEKVSEPAARGPYASLQQTPEPAPLSSPPGVTRMYRGIGNNVWPSEHGDALFFSTDPARAATFGQVHYVDVSAAEMAKFERSHSERILQHEPIAKNDWRTADPGIISRLKPLDIQTKEQRTGKKAANENAQRATAEPRALGKTARAIHTACKVTQSAEQLQKVLAADHIALARVTVEEAKASERPVVAPRFDDKRYEPWMMASGGIAGLNEAHRESAERSYQKWTETNPDAAAKHDFADYVQYVQGKWADEQRRPEERPRMMPAYKEGEIVAVDGRGSVYRLNERTTGQTQPDIKARLGEIDPTRLMDVTAAVTYYLKRRQRIPKPCD